MFCWWETMTVGRQIIWSRIRSTVSGSQSVPIYCSPDVITAHFQKGNLLTVTVMSENTFKQHLILETVAFFEDLLAFNSSVFWTPSFFSVWKMTLNRLSPIHQSLYYDGQENDKIDLLTNASLHRFPIHCITFAIYRKANYGNGSRMPIVHKKPLENQIPEKRAPNSFGSRSIETKIFKKHFSCRCLSVRCSCAMTFTKCMNGCVSTPERRHFQTTGMTSLSSVMFTKKEQDFN